MRVLPFQWALSVCLPLAPVRVRTLSPVRVRTLAPVRGRVGVVRKRRKRGRHRAGDVGNGDSEPGSWVRLLVRVFNRVV